MYIPPIVQTLANLANLTPSEVKAKTGVEYARFHQYEQGHIRPKLQTIRAIATELDLTVQVVWQTFFPDEPITIDTLIAFAGLTIKEFTRVTNIEPRTIKGEGGVHSFPRADTFYRVADALQVDPFTLTRAWNHHTWLGDPDDPDLRLRILYANTTLTQLHKAMKISYRLASAVYHGHAGFSPETITLGAAHLGITPDEFCQAVANYQQILQPGLQAILDVLNLSADQLAERTDIAPATIHAYVARSRVPPSVHQVRIGTAIMNHLYNPH